MYLSNSIQFEHCYATSIHKVVLERFLEVPDSELIIDWEAIGYKNANSCQCSWALTIRKNGYPLTVSMKHGEVRIIKDQSIWFADRDKKKEVSA